ncbi:Sir2 family NAD+-dependent deacetylase [Microvirga sp. W0021]|uniref:NAD-dependent protein deacylase n=1 Tax=Hohaiivirga grylli TaxID=3133970 RepID=A0ABV0BIL4_9HYPH
MPPRLLSLPVCEQRRQVLWKKQKKNGLLSVLKLKKPVSKRQSTMSPQIIKPYNIVILTGAGISAESGIPTFRAADGLWENHRVQDVATPEGFMHDPELVQRFYNERRAVLHSDNIKPNAAHEALARLQREHKGKVTLVTQNIDNLHERAGSTGVIHMHGELLKVRCVETDHIYDWEGDVTAQSRCTCCTPANWLRPHVVWFGEIPVGLEEISDAMDDVDLFVAIGTSGNVYPAAGFVSEARAMGAKTIEINLEPANNNHLFNDGLYGLASEKVPQWVDSLLSET